MFFRSLLKHSGLGVPFGHSSMPQLNNNFCLAGENIRVGNKCLVVECIEAEKVCHWVPQWLLQSLLG